MGRRALVLGRQGRSSASVHCGCNDDQHPARGQPGGLFTGGFQSEGIVPGGPSATVPGFTVTQLQSDSTFSLLGVALGPDGAQEIGCGSAVDLAPATTATSFPVNAAPSPISFTASEPVRFDGRELLRKGVIFELVGLDNVAGFDDFTQKFTPGGFASFEALLDIVCPR